MKPFAEIQAPAVVGLLLAAVGLVLGGPTMLDAAEPIRLHPENPHYFLWRGQPTVLITSGEHYGAVLNLDFDYERYLDELKRHRFNLTRVFSGAYREVPGSFNITGNTLAPAAGRFSCPWARGKEPGANDGGNKFDLTRWDDTYFVRLTNFVAQAGKRGVVVELVLFCTMYDDTLWNASPMNARNNVNGIGQVDRSEVYGAKDPRLLEAQRAMVRKLVTELNRFDNVYFELCNEPYERAGLAREWNEHLIETIVATEAALPNRHLIAQGFPNAAVADLDRRVSVLNFHASTPDPVRLNYALNRVIAFDETGGDRSDRTYRRQGWEFILSGGGVFDHLDLSFTSDRPDGGTAALPPGTPGGGSPQLRRQLGVLKEFIEGFDFLRMKPDETTVKSARALDAEGRPGREADKLTPRCLAEPGRAYAIYLQSGPKAELTLALPPGSYKVDWVNPRSGSIEKTALLRHETSDTSVVSPTFAEDIALRVRRESEIRK